MASTRPSRSPTTPPAGESLAGPPANRQPTHTLSACRTAPPTLIPCPGPRPTPSASSPASRRGTRSARSGRSTSSRTCGCGSRTGSSTLPGGITVILHPSSAWLSAAHPFLPAARLASAPAGRRYLAGWATADRAPHAQRQRPGAPGGRRGLAARAARDRASASTRSWCSPPTTPRMPPPWGPRAFSRYLRWAWLIEGGAQYFSGQSASFRPAVLRRLNEGASRPSRPRRATRSSSAAASSTCSISEVGRHACELLVSRLPKGGPAAGARDRLRRRGCGRSSRSGASTSTTSPPDPARVRRAAASARAARLRSDQRPGSAPARAPKRSRPASSPAASRNAGRCGVARAPARAAPIPSKESSSRGRLDAGRRDEDVPRSGGEEVGDVEAAGAAQDARDALLEQDALHQLGLGEVEADGDAARLAAGEPRLDLAGALRRARRPARPPPSRRRPAASRSSPQNCSSCRMGGAAARADERARSADVEIHLLDLAVADREGADDGRVVMLERADQVERVGPVPRRG